MQAFNVARSSVRATSVAGPLQRGITISAVRAFSGSHIVDPEKAAEELEKGKQESIKGQKDNTVGHAPGWNEKIASESEAIIKSSKDTSSPAELAKETVEKLTKENK